MQKECKTYRAFSKPNLDAGTVRAVDCRGLLVDLRAGKSPIRIADYTGTAGYANQDRLPEAEPMSV